MEICRFFNESSGCLAGASCPFAHENTISTISVSLKSSKPSSQIGSVKLDKICSFFLTLKGCNKGADCRFLHVVSDSPNSSISTQREKLNAKSGTRSPVSKPTRVQHPTSDPTEKAKFEQSVQLRQLEKRFSNSDGQYKFSRSKGENMVELCLRPTGI